VWLDTGTHEALSEASEYVKAIENRTGLKIACLEEIAYNKKWVSAVQLQKLAEPMKKNQYGQYLLRIIKDDK
jgi:glucose-1-phosphate thymidylyltransferase